ncbi:MAG: hypothetical protein J4N97_12275 [Chloroflexi bacterium]|nr:hypothetical protein [Chloroflexota bacterium]
MVAAIGASRDAGTSLTIVGAADRAAVGMSLLQTVDIRGRARMIARTGSGLFLTIVSRTAAGRGHNR